MKLRIPRLVPMLALWWPLAAAAAEGTDATVGGHDATDAVADASTDTPGRIQGRVPEEVRAWREAHDRFSNRMSEFEAETKAYLDARENHEREKLSSGYDELIESLQDLELSKRDVAIEGFEDFLSRYPESEYASHVRFRLGELYFERARDQWLEDAEAYARLEAELGFERMDELPPMPRIDLQPSIDLYERIIEDNVDLPREEQYEFLDGAYYMMGFAYNEPNSEQRDDDAAQEAFRGLLAARPDSGLADVANLFLGNYAFDYGDFDLAISHYQEIYDNGPDGPHYIDALYQLAWSYYKKASDPQEYRVALDLFSDVLDESERQFYISGKQGDYAPDAVKYIAISFSEIADKRFNAGEDDITPVKVAQEYFRRMDEPAEWEWDVYVALGEVLTTQARFDVAVDVYRWLQDNERWTNHPKNPEWQFQVVKLLASGIGADQEAAAAALVDLTERYNTDTEWWKANRNNPDALRVARKYIEDSLVHVATEYFHAAEQSGVADDYLVAAAKFQEYLDKFPISDDYYENQWYMAYALYRAGANERAAEEYRLLLKSERHHPYGDGAAFHIYRVRRAVLQESPGQIDGVPEGAEVEAMVDTMRRGDDGNPVQRPVYALSPAHAAYIEAADLVLARRFTPPDDPDLQDFSEFMDANRGAIMYEAAQILYHHGHFEEARPRLMKVIEEYRYTMDGSRAAALLVNSFSEEGDLAKVRLWTTDFVRDPPGPPEMAEAKLDEFENLLEGTAFKQCEEFLKNGLRLEAADCFIQFVDDFPQSEYRNFALYNAANNYDKVGRAERAIELFERYVEEYPDDDRSRGLYLRIAITYEAIFDFQKAIHYYEQLVRRFPDYIDSPTAQYNAAFLRIGIGDHGGAAQAFVDYSRKFPELPASDRESVYYQAGEQYELVGAFQAKKFYQDYLREWGMQNPEHAFDAKYSLAQIYLEEGNKRKHEQYLDEILADFKKLAADGMELGWYARHYAAESAFREVQAAYDDFVADELTGNEEKDVPFLLDVKPAELKEFEELARTILRFQDFEYSAGALYLEASAYLYYANLGLTVRPPEHLSWEEQDVFFEALEQMLYPKMRAVEAKGVDRFTKLIELAESQGQWTHWIEKSYAALNNLNPMDWPALKDEIRGGTDSSIYPEVAPVDMAPPEAVADDDDPRPEDLKGQGAEETSP